MKGQFLPRLKSRVSLPHLMKENIALKNHVSEEKLIRAKQCLIDNGVERDEAGTVLQALCYILLDTEIFPE